MVEQVWSFQELYIDNFRQYNGTQQILHLQNYSDVQHLIHDDQRRFRPISKKTLKKAAKGKMIGQDYQDRENLDHMQEYN